MMLSNGAGCPRGMRNYGFRFPSLTTWRNLLQVRLLGTMEILDDRGSMVSIGAPMLRATLAALALRARHVVPSGELVDQLWGSCPPPTAGPTVRNYIKRLRRVLPGNRIRTEAGGYRLEVDRNEIDVERFRDLLLRSRRANPEDLAYAAETLDEALALWRGTPLTDISDSPLRSFEQTRLEELHLIAAEERFAIGLRLGEHAELLEEIIVMGQSHWARERLVHHWMTALYRCGRTADALNVYRSTRKRMVEELGIEPGAELRELEQAILRADPALTVWRISLECETAV
ncbi:AfsR/SARP family transcriptional regulator [Streptomyces sp. PSAA01]|uniref:AfsR/SARP family transcriptional regulator n=1 Tax=Streptomyces sp. PSAA01 TaxID=2912762 RepID=UPI0027E395C1|nr:AfsR/SARP family transcriptional regulator [Streptomyces sp. PSAA01]